MALTRILSLTFMLSYGSLLVQPAPTNKNGFSFALYYSDHMVLQKAPQKANVWGYSTKLNDVVHVTVKGNGVTHTVQTKVHRSYDGKNMWKVALPPMPAGGPYTVTAASSLSTLTLTDVLFGDVWLCAGQSNMQFTVSMDFNAAQEIADGAHYPHNRLFTTKRTQTKTPKYDIAGSLGGPPWSHFSAVCWFYGKELYNQLKYPIGLIAADWGASRIEPWSSPDALSKCPNEHYDIKPDSGFPEDPSVAWNGMIHPLLPLTIYGSIWYQGESNNHHGDAYNCNFPAMIDDWRDKFNKESGGQTSRQFPFGFVQLAAFNKAKSYDFTDIRWAQTARYGYVPNPILQNVFMAVTLDLPDFDSPHHSIHPRHKKIMSSRLALAGLSVAYFKSGEKYQGPYPSTISNRPTDSTITIQFDHGKSPIGSIRSNNGFEVCCADRQYDAASICITTAKNWVDAPVSKSTKHDVTLHYPDHCRQGLKVVKAVRYLWHESPCAFQKCPVYSVENQLPAPPFQYFLKEHGDVHIIG